MKCGAVRDRNFLTAPMIGCDDHNSASNAAPQSRHHLHDGIKKYNKYQVDSATRRMMHNHPSGDPTPSGADIRMTRELVDIAKPLGVAIHDHIIVGREGHASFRSLGLI